MTRILIDDKIPYLHGQAEQLGCCTYMPGARISPADVKDKDVLIVRTRTRCDAALLQGSSVRLVVTATSGYDHLDVEWLQQAGIAWRCCPASNAMSVVQYVITTLLRLHLMERLDLTAATVGIVGVGNIGSRLASSLSGLGVRTLLCDPPRAEKGEAGLVGMNELISQSDVITFHTPLTHNGPHATYHLAGAHFFDLCRERRPIVINAARGGVVDEELLLRALCDGTVREAVIDTWQTEPSTDRELRDRCLIATPHIAGYSADGKANATRMSLQAVAEWLGTDIAFEVEPPQIDPSFAYNTEQPPVTEALRYYDPLFDSNRFKAAPMQFEQQRGTYPLRRECPLTRENVFSPLKLK